VGCGACPDHLASRPNTCTLDLMIEPRIRGEQGYGDWCTHLFEMGLCSCDGCGGHLFDGTCISCGCRHGIHEPSRLHRQRVAAWVPVTEPGQCAHADAVRTEERRERDHQAGGAGRVAVLRARRPMIGFDMPLRPRRPLVEAVGRPAGPSTAWVFCPSTVAWLRSNVQLDARRDSRHLCGLDRWEAGACEADSSGEG
jgi:hypothetical protein